MNSIMDCPIAPPGGWGAQKPPPGVPIDWSHPLTRDLISFWAFNDGSGRRLTDACGRFHGTRVGSDKTFTPTPYGMAGYTNGTTDWWNCGACYPSPAHGTLFVDYTYLSYTGSYPTPMSNGYSYSDRNGVNIYFANRTNQCITGEVCDSSSRTTCGFSITSTAYIFRRYQLAFVWTSTAQQMLLHTQQPSLFSNYLNPNSRTISTQPTFGAYPLVLGCGGEQTSATAFNGYFHAAGVWNRPITQTEFDWLCREPFSMFASAPSPAFDTEDMFRVHNPGRRGSRGVLQTC